jgi:hypothetical protein
MPRPFEQILVELRNGRFSQQLTDEFDELARAVHSTGKSGTINLKLTLKPSGENGLEIEGKTSTTIPKADVGKGFLFFDAEGNLTRSDTRQREMQLEAAGVTPLRAEANA